MTEQKKAAIEAQVRYNEAQDEEVATREKGDPIAVNEAKARQVAALDDLTKAQAAGEEETVVLISPNPYTTLTDSNGVEFVDGKAEGVPKSLAEKYCLDFDGYRIA